MRWIRLNIDFDDSPWLFNLSAEVQLAWIKLLCHVKRDGVKGRCRALLPKVAAKKWGVSTTVVDRLIEAAEDANALDVEDGMWTVLNWDKYQTPDPTGAERSARYRGRKRPSDEEVESENECVTRDLSVTCHATETKTSTKTKKEKQEKKAFSAETPTLGAPPLEGSRQLPAAEGPSQFRSSAMERPLSESGRLRIAPPQPEIGYLPPPSPPLTRQFGIPPGFMNRCAASLGVHPETRNAFAAKAYLGETYEANNLLPQPRRLVPMVTHG